MGKEIGALKIKRTLKL